MPGRSCADHIYTLTSVLRHRQSKGESTFACFIDAEKAFNKLDRDLLFDKLLNIDINGKMYNSIKNICLQSLNIVNVNGFLTDWFESNCRMRQGDTLSPSLFRIYINDLVKDLIIGIELDQKQICILIDAADMVVFAKTEQDLHCILDVIVDCGWKWHVKFNGAKSNVVHFRKPNTPQTEYNFKIGRLSISVVDKYKYLGVILNDTIDFNVIANVLADPEGHGLGAILNKYKKHGGIGYYTYTTKYNAGVCPILDCIAEIWCCKEYPKINTIQNRAIRVFMGVHNFAPNLGITGNFEWAASNVRHKVAMI